MDHVSRREFATAVAGPDAGSRFRGRARFGARAATLAGVRGPYSYRLPRKSRPL